MAHSSLWLVLGLGLEMMFKAHQKEEIINEEKNTTKTTASPFRLTALYPWFYIYYGKISYILYIL